MNSQYQPGDYEAIHTNPIWREQANFIIAASIGENTVKQEWEQLWARMIEGRRFEVCCIPFFAYGLSLGDEVITDEFYTIVEISNKSGNITFRIWLGYESDDLKKELLLNFLSENSFLYEKLSDNFISVNASNSRDSEFFETKMKEITEKSKIIFEKSSAI